MTYNFDFKPTRRLFINVCTWLEQHIDRYFPTEKPDRNTMVYKSMIGGKNAVVSFSKQGISVESDDDLSEYFNRRSHNNEFEIYDRSAKERLKRAGISLAYYVFDMNAFLIAFIIEMVMYRLPGSVYTLAFLSVPLTLIVCFVVFFLTFKPIYENMGENTWRTLFIQGGGIFTVLHIAFLILETIAYVVYKLVKESYVIPNFTVEQIERGRELYNNISEIMGTAFLAYLFIVPLPLILSLAISSHRAFYTENYTVKKNRQETDKIETPQIERN